MTERQVSAELLDLKAKAAALCFRSQQDALNYARHTVEDSNRRLAAQSINAVARYLKGEIGIYIGLRTLRDGHECDLVFLRVPANTKSAWADSFTDPIFGFNPGAEENGRGCSDKGPESEVFIGVSNLVYGPKGLIPSFVTIEILKERLDFRGKILASSGHMVPEFLFRGPADGKFDCPQARSFGSDGGCVSALIENGTKIVSGIEKNAGQYLRKLLNDFDFMKIINGIRIRINEAGPWLFCDKSVSDNVEIVDVMLCAQE
jgi:hypothetical protein